MPKGIAIDLSGRRFGAWLVLDKSSLTSSNNVMWNCRCDCGRTGVVTTGNLRTGKSTRCRSCGNRKENNRRWSVAAEEGGG